MGRCIRIDWSSPTASQVENIGMTLGIMPVTGLPLPFVSYGGSSMFATWLAVGLLQSIRMQRPMSA